MPNKIQYSDKTSRTVGISGSSINNGAGSLGSEIDFSVSGARETAIDFELVITHGTAPAANSPWLVYLLTAADGTNYEDGGSSTQPARTPDGILNVRAVTSAQRVSCNGVRLRTPSKTKILLWNATGQNATSATLSAWTHSPEIQ